MLNYITLQKANQNFITDKSGSTPSTQKNKELPPSRTPVPTGDTTLFSFNGSVNNNIDDEFQLPVHHSQLNYYGEHSRQHYRLSIPNDLPDAPVNVAVLTHGGSFTHGSIDDEDFRKIESKFLDEGYVVITPEYRVFDGETELEWPEPIYDIRDGINHAFNYIDEELGLEVEQKIYLGNSAGATAGGILLYTDNFDKNDKKIPTFDKFLSLAGVFSKNALPVDEYNTMMAKYGIEDWKEFLPTKEFDPLSTVTDAALVEGIHDGKDRYTQTEKSHAEVLNKYLEENGVNSQVAWVKKENFTGHSGPKNLLVKGVTKFMEKVWEFFNS